MISGDLFWWLNQMFIEQTADSNSEFQRLNSSLLTAISTPAGQEESI